jgi:hypothetical protein
MDALPLERHAVHGTWKDTLHPQLASCASEAAHAGEPGSPALRRQAMFQQLPRPAADRHDQHATGTSGRRPRPGPGRGGPSSATANSAEAEPDGQQETSAASHPSTMRHAC